MPPRLVTLWLARRLLKLRVTEMEYMEILKSELLLKLDTKRLLTIKRKLNRVVARLAHESEWDVEAEKEYKEYNAYLNEIKTILATREHIQR